MTDLKLRASVCYLEDAITSMIDSGEVENGEDQTELEHFFTPKIEDFNACLYARQLSVPAGLTFTGKLHSCLLYTSPSPRDGLLSRMPSSA